MIYIQCGLMALGIVFIVFILCFAIKFLLHNNQAEVEEQLIRVKTLIILNKIIKDLDTITINKFNKTETYTTYNPDINGVSK